MKILIFFSFFISILIPEKSCKQQHDVVAWNESKKLMWSDFKGEIGNDLIYGAEASVQVKFDYTIKKGIISRSEIICLFLKKFSWHIDTTQYGLKHEQGHFDIGEIVARRLRKTIDGYKKESLTIDAQKLDSAYYYYVDELLNMQRIYDSTTNHSLNLEQQSIYNSFIETQLDSLKQYKK